jgi:hypothetical protein
LIIAIFGTLACVSVPELSPSKAAEVIALTSEFNARGQIVAVTKAASGDDSLKGTGYATFSFRTRDEPSKLIDAEAEFRYWGGDWHLLEFRYGKPPHVEVVWIRGD